MSHTRIQLPLIEAFKLLTESPKISPENYRLFYVIHFSTLVGFLGHFFFIGLFAWAGVRTMALVNIVSCLIFLISFLVNLNGSHGKAAILGIGEVVTHAILAVIYVGWNSGFHYYILSLVPIVFYVANKINRTKVLVSVLLCSIYTGIYFYSQSHPPLVSITLFQSRIFAITNIAVTFFVLSAVAHYYRLAVVKAEMGLNKANQNLQILSQTDPLTRLLNRRAILDWAEKEQQAQTGHSQMFCLIMGDVDHFKLFNDHYGHDFGDQVLINVANVFQRILRDEDHIARWGGEEFLMLLPDTTLEDGKKVAERLRQTIQSTPIEFQGTTAGVTITFGVSTWTGAEDIAAAIRSADQAMLNGKRAGKNCVVAAPLTFSKDQSI
jgi:diguanylate cyclase (GGDEF)-like protein